MQGNVNYGPTLPGTHTSHRTACLRPAAAGPYSARSGRLPAV